MKLTDRSFSALDNRDYFKNMKHETLWGIVVFEVFSGFNSWNDELLTRTKNKITNDENDENLSHLEISEAVLVHRNYASNDYQQDSQVFYIFIPNKLFGPSLDISPKAILSLKTFYSKFSYIEIWFSYQNSKPLDIEDKIKIALVINESVEYKKWCYSIEAKGYEFFKS